MKNGTLLVMVVVAGIACSSTHTDESTSEEPLAHEGADMIPCAPRRVLETVCQRCHSDPTLNGAPFPLVGRSDIMTKRWGVVVRELMIEELDARRMPLAPVTIEPEDRDVLLAWLRAGAPAATTRVCAASPPEDAGDDAETDAGPADGATIESWTCNDAAVDAPEEAASDADSQADAGEDGECDGASDYDAGSD